jgi:hypothetical protein
MSSKKKSTTRKLSDKDLLADAWREFRGALRVYPLREAVFNAHTAVQRQTPGTLRQVRALDRSGRRSPVPQGLLQCRSHWLPPARHHRHQGPKGRRHHGRTLTHGVPGMPHRARWRLLVKKPLQLFHRAIARPRRTPTSAPPLLIDYRSDVAQEKSRRSFDGLSIPDVTSRSSTPRPQRNTRRSYPARVKGTP